MRLHLYIASNEKNRRGLKKIPKSVLLCIAILLTVFPACTDFPTSPGEDCCAPVRGITFVDWTARGYARAVADVELDALLATGANRVVVLVTAYQRDPSDDTVLVDTRRTPLPSAVQRAVERAHAAGAEVAIKLHVDLYDGSWRAFIDPADPDAWFASYGRFVTRWAARAQDWKATQLVLGTELAGTLKHEDRWRALIADARAAYAGELCYAASWDEADRVPFWDALDLVGVDFYYPVSHRPRAERLEILAAWEPWLQRLQRLGEKAGRPVLLTELGYRSVRGAGQEPYAFDDDAPLDLQEQADLYWAALTATSGHSWLRGVYWWNWPATFGGGPDDRDFTPRGKPAQEELISAWRGTGM